MEYFAPNISLLPINLVLSMLLFWVIAKVYIVPKLTGLQPQAALLPLMIFQAFRHEGLIFIANGVVRPGMPEFFAVPAAAGDFFASMLAIAAIPLLLNNSALARPVVWAQTIEGAIDLVSAVALAAATGAPKYMGATYLIPAFYVPALLVSHLLAYRLLRQPQPFTAPSPA